MCLFAVAFQQHQRFPLILVSNRDEYFDRPTLLPDWWKDHPDIFAGRDLVAGGTWLGLNRAGCFAAVTNFREPKQAGEHWASRGEIVRDFLCFSGSPQKFISQLSEESQRYRGFNILLGSTSGLFYFNNRDGDAQQLTPGIYGLSNGRLDEPWPKVRRLKHVVRHAVRAQALDRGALFSALSCSQRACDAALPDTGVSRDKERAYSSCFVSMESYGTRSSSITCLSHREASIEHREYDEKHRLSGCIRRRIQLMR